ncbi:hypothetical protein [Nitratifractor sp.]|nr:hypothetical protein [Nitratifractor sp.]
MNRQTLKRLLDREAARRNDPAELIVLLDPHIYSVSLCLGLLKRKSYDR